MIKFSQILKIINESASDDLKRATEINSIIKYIDNQLKNYTKDNHVIRKNNNGYEIKFKDLLIILTNKRHIFNNPAEYIPSSNTIKIYNVDFNDTNNIKYNRNFLFHELVHYYDSKNVKKNLTQLGKEQSKKVKSKGYKAYINSPLEFNAHFFEYFLPDILNFIKNKEIKDFNTFFNNIKNSIQFKEFYSLLEDKYKRKLLKRIATIYQEIKDPQKREELQNINISNIEREKKRYTWLNKLWDKLGD